MFLLSDARAQKRNNSLVVWNRMFLFFFLKVQRDIFWMETTVISHLTESELQEYDQSKEQHIYSD